MVLLIRACLALGRRELSFARLGLPGAGEPARGHLEAVGRAILDGCRLALGTRDPAVLDRRLAALPDERRGLAFEGAATAAAALDALTLARLRRTRRLLSVWGERYAPFIQVGVGWALARLPMRQRRLLARLDPLLGPLVYDGWGCHEGFFRRARAVDRRKLPSRLREPWKGVFDQGLGRSLWFAEGANPARLAAAVRSFPEDRRDDLWSGVGIAAAYAGPMEPERLAFLREAAADHLAALAQGAVFAAVLHQRAVSGSAAADAACTALCGLNVGEAARLAAEVAAETPARSAGEPGPHPFTAWRRAIRSLVYG
jgi:hypothetical protein